MSAMKSHNINDIPVEQVDEYMSSVRDYLTNMVIGTVKYVQEEGIECGSHPYIQYTIRIIYEDEACRLDYDCSFDITEIRRKIYYLVSPRATAETIARPLRGTRFAIC